MNGAEQTDSPSNEDSATDASTPPRRTRSARSRLILQAESDSESDKGARPRRRGRQRKPKQSEGTPDDTPKPPSNKSKTKNPADGGAVESDGEYIQVTVGDCVLLDSGNDEEHFVALVSSVQVSQNREKATAFTAQWYYKPDDVREEVRATIPGGVLPNEVFLSPHKDKNSVEAVVGLCNVVSPEEYAEISSELERGFRERSQKPYFVCRFKYYPSRSIKKALEPLSDEDIRGGLGPQKPKVGDQYQATLPQLQKKPAAHPAYIPWRRDNSVPASLARQVWSPLVVETQEVIIRQYRELIDSIRFAVGNIVKFYNHENGISGVVRCIVLKHVPSESIQVCTSTGTISTTLKGDLCSPLPDDIALNALYSARFSIAFAVQACSTRITDAQKLEKEAFKQEVLIFAELAAQARARQAMEADAAARKRRK
ncbi:hypothetical protein ATCC90586_009942 [Pythium insidiosum]|nr:hypothetical protein ATCC90586_009942 [Pythium insidiosum]